MGGKGAFTLVELLAVLAVAGVLMGLGVAVAAGLQSQGREARAQAGLARLVQAVEERRAQSGGLPAGVDFAALAAGAGEAVDPWGRPYAYEVTGGSYRLWSTGPDGDPATQADNVEAVP